MRVKKLMMLAAVGLAAQTLASGCLVFPELKDRVVELATSGSVTADFHAQGSSNAYLEVKTIDIRDSIDVAQALSDAGIDVSDVKSINLGGVAYRITVPDPDPSKQVSSGTVTVQRAGGTAADLITGLTAHAGAATGWLTPTLDPAGVSELNSLLADILAELKGGAPANETITYQVSGTASAGPTDFHYQLRLTLNIVGTVKVKIIE